MTYDPITLALVQNRLDHISRQMGWVMLRTARSPIFQSHDFSCFITGPTGYLVSQADGCPVHTGSGGFAVRGLLKAFGDDIHEGDAFLLNDPYLAGGNHLPDWVIARPVFSRGTVVGFTCNRAHQSDIGGGAAGTYNPLATEIFHEGIRLPPIRVVERGEIRKDLWDMLLANTRTPHLLDGDLRAMLGSTQIGCERVAAIFDDLGHEQGMAYLDGILDHADRRFRAEVESLPDGVYVGEEISNNDCFTRTEIRYRVTLTVSGDQLTVDFTGTSPQIKGFKNSSFANTHAATYTGLSSFFDPDLPRNEGTFRSVKLIIPYGCTLNPKPPAATTFATAFPAHDIIQACWKALSQAVPSKTVAGWGKAIIPLSAGVDDAGATTYVLYHWNGLSGGGAVMNRDGLNQIAHLSTLGGLTLPNVELWEQLYPIHVHRHEFRRDAAGPGQWRGGTGIEYEADVLTDANYSFRGEGLFDPSGFGAAGGLAGAAGQCTTFDGTGKEFTPPQYSLVGLPPVRIVLSSPAGGGVGSPSHRDPQSVLRDVRDGIVSETAAQSIYKVALTPDGRSVDAERTRALRASA
ncbi:hydantoinase B/oxoprolinase family protein [Microbaculum marinisediminis]|uniref:Hydantoinase B/oxoprolinase family protein n=1 Tax=Microbaculum marinisediminis TaxID=2931392 RepID=A0AAW5R203_9HYPH|nr:hydantoinase B/oxoprolinase family protein [Microbaculum sp. A6E488]MCT8974321.1 hydantoinase B/oxoprolinase family protein [Microbaculum sp. A6E488]